MTDEERERILAEARENVRTRDFPHAVNIHRALVEDPPARRAHEEPRREWQRPRPEPPKPEPDSSRGQQATWAAWNAWADSKIATAIADERAFMREAIGGAIAKMLDDEREEQKRALSLEVRELKIELAKLQLAITELKTVAAGGDRRAILDLPNPLTTRNVN
jgi:hypothetical protein